MIDGCPHCCKLYPAEMAQRLRARVRRGETLIQRLAGWLRSYEAFVQAQGEKILEELLRIEAANTVAKP